MAAGLEYGEPMNTSRAALCMALGLGLAALPACKETAEPPVAYDASRVRRLFQPPSGEVRAVPPHAIHASGVGPYVLGASLRDVLGMLARGPRVTLVQIDDVVDYSLVRAESDGLIIGVEPLGGVAFVSVLDTETARIESGEGVGSTVDALTAALGPRLAAADLAMHPRILGFASLPSARFLLDEAGAEVAAVVVLGATGTGRGRQVDAVVGTAPVAGRDAGARDAGARSACSSSEHWAGRASDIARVAETTPDQVERSLRHGCFSAGAAEALVHAGDRLVVIGGAPDALRRLAVHTAPGTVFAAPLDVDGDDRSELAVVYQREAMDERVIEVEILRLEGSRFARLGHGEVYRLSGRNAAWVGARLHEIELLVELRAGGDWVEVTGLYVHRNPTGPDTVTPLVPTAVELRRRRASGGKGGAGHASADAGTGDAARAPAAAGSPRHGSSAQGADAGAAAQGF